MQMIHRQSLTFLQKSKKYLDQFLKGRNVKKLEDTKEELERFYGAKNFLKKTLAYYT